MVCDGRGRDGNLPGRDRRQHCQHRPADAGARAAHRFRHRAVGGVGLLDDRDDTDAERGPAGRYARQEDALHQRVRRLHHRLAALWAGAHGRLADRLSRATGHRRGNDDGPGYCDCDRGLPTGRTRQSHGDHRCGGLDWHRPGPCAGRTVDCGALLALDILRESPSRAGRHTDGGALCSSHHTRRRPALRLYWSCHPFRQPDLLAAGPDAGSTMRALSGGVHQGGVDQPSADDRLTAVPEQPVQHQSDHRLYHLRRDRRHVGLDALLS